MKRCLTSSLFWGLQVTTTKRFHHAPIKMAKLKNNNDNNNNKNQNKLIKPRASKDSEQLELSYIAGGNGNGSHIGKVWQFLIKLNTYLPHTPRYSHKIPRICVYTKICVQMFMVILFIMVPSGTSPSAGKWLDKWGYNRVLLHL